ncbi:MAG TPA: hypothetical protein VK348_06800, partial [Planctomycetota bacterium]|nr:hypothetical protein [Planctomycetota bacterium]
MMHPLRTTLLTACLTLLLLPGCGSTDAGQQPVNRAADAARTASAPADPQPAEPTMPDPKPAASSSS